jgi:hypothetical protein
MGASQMQVLRQRRSGKWLGEKRKAPGTMRSLANGGVVIPGHEDDWRRDIFGLETLRHLDPRNVAKINVEQDAGGFVKIVVLGESLRRSKQETFVAKLPQQPRYALQHSGVVIDDKDKVANCQFRLP